LLELENEKAVAPIPSPADGRVSAIRVKSGDKLSVGQVILTLTESGAAAAPSAPSAAAAPKRAAKATEAPAPPPPAPATAAAEPAADYEVRTAGAFPPPASPSLRKLAKELGIDLARVRGSERGGRIVMPDLRQYIQQLQQTVFAKKKEQPRPAAAEPIDFSKWGPVSAKPISPLRQVIGRRMVESWTTIPHVTQFDEADVTRMNELRKKHAPAYEAQGARLTVTAFVLQAVVAVLKKHPIFNASWDEASEQIVFKDYYHLGVAVDTEAGLLVPVLRDVDSKSLLQLSKEIQESAERARERKLGADDMKGGTFTISNQGGIGSAHFTPIINKPEAAILGLGRGATKPVVKEGQVVARLLLPLALSYDHRLIDGAQAARFMVDLVAALENFNEGQVKL
ncbi:MAG TPA: 2-oxo acid dehydrogenase subunit E2, partial [Caulobacteraceae bacterium]|nr:2-oxo acid dehydrogenase subunit E2 [Caulobacteraceae bacterium]